jgi:hypothetical protein
MAKRDDPKFDEAFNHAMIARHLAAVTELRFSSKVKLVKRTFNGNTGWMLLVESAVSGYAMNFADQKLYPTQHRAYDVFKDEEFFTKDIWTNEALILDLVENLGEKQQVVDPGRGFISKYLNNDSFHRLHDHWKSDEARIELKSR